VCNFSTLDASKNGTDPKEQVLMEMEIKFPGGARVDASFGPYTVHTDQPPPGGEGSAPTPFAVFLTSIGTCAGIYVLGFLRKRGLPTEGVSLHQHMRANPITGMVDEISIDILVPPDFPERYYEALIRTAELCAVKKHFENPPSFNIQTRVKDLIVNS
jgi:putative redox protein